MKITKSQLRQIIKEEVNEVFAGYSSGGHPSSNVRGSSYGSRNAADREEEYEVLIGKKMGNKIRSRRVHVFATSRDDAKKKAQEENPRLRRNGSGSLGIWWLGRREPTKHPKHYLI